MAKVARVVLITGCSTGIGRALAQELASRGHRVFATARRVEALSELAAAGIDTLPLDVTDSASVSSAVEQTMKRAGRIDMLINNAGINRFGPLAELPLDDVRRMLETNVTGVLAMTQAVFPHMAEARSGCIVNIGSVVGLLPTPFAGVYCGTKAAVHMLSDVLRMELEPFGIDVVVVQPGGVQSNIAESGADGIERYGEPGSRYHPAKRGLDKRAGASQHRAMPTTDFARVIADAILASHPPRVVRAGRGAMTYPALSHLPAALRDPLMKRMFALDELGH